MWFVGCRRGRLPESLTLHCTDCESLTDDPAATVVNEGLHYSDVGTEDHQKSSPLSSAMCICSTNSISASSQTLCMTQNGGSEHENMEFVCLEAASVDAATDICASSTSVAAADDISSDSHDSLYHVIRSRLHSVEDIDHRQRLHDSLRILLQFFEAEYLDAGSKTSPTFPLCLMEQYTKLIKDDVSFYSTDG